MKDLTYTTIANDDRSIQVSTWQQRSAEPFGLYDWHYKFTINGRVIAEGTIEEDCATCGHHRDMHGEKGCGVGTGPESCSCKAYVNESAQAVAP